MSNYEPKRINIKSIKNPEFLKELNYRELDLLSEDIKNYILNVTSKSGGHLSSNLGVIDATIALCRSFNFPKDKIIFDVGHQCYTYKILTGRSLERFRLKDGTSGFQKMSESEYDAFEAGHSSTSISAAVGFAYARDIKKEKYDIIAFIGDSSIANGLAFEGLNNGSSGNHKVIIVVNDNNMSISPAVGALSKFFTGLSISAFYRKSKNAYRKILVWNFLGRKIYSLSKKIKNWVKRHVIRIGIFDNLGYKVLGPIDGHNIKRMEATFAKAKKVPQSVVIIIQTVKGKGYKFAEEDNVGTWHGVSTFNKKTGKLPNDNHHSWSEFYEKLVAEKMETDKNVVTIVPATGFGSYLKPVFDKYPDRCFDVGIAEEHALTMSSAISISGLHPIISIYSTFLQRGYDQLSHDLARMNCDSTILIDRAGLVGQDGETHQGIYDEQFLLGIPNVTVAMAASKCEAEILFKESFNHHGPFCIRYPRESFDDTKQENIELSYGKWREIIKGNNTCIVSVGPVGVQLSREIKSQNLDATLVDAIYQKPMDEEYIQKLLNYKRIIIYDPYSVKEGFASILSSKLVSLKYKGDIVIKAIPNTFVKQATIEEQRQEFGLTINDIIDLISSK